MFPLGRYPCIFQARLPISCRGGYPLLYGSGLLQAAQSARTWLLPCIARAVPAPLLRGMLNTLPPPAWQAARVATGFVAALVARVAIKAALTPTVRAVLACVPQQLRATWQPRDVLPIAALEAEEQALARMWVKDSGGATRGGAGEASVGMGRSKAEHASTGQSKEPTSNGSSRGLDTHARGQAPGSKSADTIAGAAVRMRTDGYPYDADAVRRYLVYAGMAATTIVFHHATEFDVADVWATMGGKA